MATVEQDLSTRLEGFAGELLRPEDAGYDEARRIHNGLIDKRPALIARCGGTVDVIAAVNAAREEGLEVSVRGGGHNVAGKAVTDGGVMIDLSLMRAIHVDPSAGTARAQGGCTWADVNRETQLHGLAVTGGVVSSTGIAGLTLGGGIGWLMSKHGLATDNLVSVEIVTADGRVLTASETENPDLFWGLRGGGGNFGVVTSFLYRLHPVGPIVTGGLIVHAFDDAGAVLRAYRDLTADIPDELTVVAALLHTPEGAKAAGMTLCHVGAPDQAERDLAPIKSAGTPLDVQVGPMPYAALNQMLDAAYPKGALNYWKSTFLDLSDGAIDTLVERFAACPSQLTLLALEHFHGAVTRVPVDAMAVPHRHAGYNLVITSVWMDPAATEENVAWTRETYSALQPYGAARRYVNYLDTDDGEDAVKGAYGPNYDRLVELKTKYDPGNLFRLNQNIPPRAS